MISSRNNHLVIGKRAVLVRDVVDSVCARNSVDFITRRFPVNLQEIWECIDAIADIDRLGRGVHLKVNNSSNDRQNINLETIQISDIFLLKQFSMEKYFCLIQITLIHYLIQDLLNLQQKFMET